MPNPYLRHAIHCQPVQLSVAAGAHCVAAEGRAGGGGRRGQGAAELAGRLCVAWGRLLANAAGHLSVSTIKRWSNNNIHEGCSVSQSQTL